MPLRIANGKFYLEGRLIFLLSGSMHYWRLDHKKWGAILDRVCQVGFETICTYVPWGVHEIAQGVFDFGELNPDYNLDAFLKLCEEKDIHVLLRPGPNINSELTYFGFPKRIINDPEIQSITADGTPVIFPSPPRMFPVPSYASEKFYQEVGIYFDRVCPIITKHLHPDGCVIGVQADNELSFFMRTQPYDHDYSKGAIRLYKRFLEEKYKDIDLLNKLYHKDYAAFNEIPAPRDFDAKNKNDLPYYLDWIEYKEYYLQYGLSRITEMLKERGVNTLIYHNLPEMCAKPPYNQIKTEEIVDLVGFDLYCYKEEYFYLKQAIQYLNGTSRAPFIAEFAAGFFALPTPAKPIMPDDSKFTTYAALMHGLSGINIYMLVERERWAGSPIDRFGGVRKEQFEFYQQFNQLLKRMNYPGLSGNYEGILLINRDCARLELASSLLTPIPIFKGVEPEYYVSEDDLGFDDIIQLEYVRQWDALYYGFGAAKYAVTIGDTELPPENLSKYRMVAVPTFDFMTGSVQEKLLRYAESGGCLVIGPRVPKLDERMKECDLLARHLLEPHEGMEPVFADPDTPIYQHFVGKGSIVHFAFLLPRIADGVPGQLIRIIERIATTAGLSQIIPCFDPKIDVMVYTADGRKVLFVANAGIITKEVAIGGRYLDLNSEELVGPVITIPAYTVRILEVDLP